MCPPPPYSRDRPMPAHAAITTPDPPSPPREIGLVQVVAAASVPVGLDSSVKGAAHKVCGVLTPELASVWGISWLGLSCHYRTLFMWTFFLLYFC
jgi:hypothetical protein